MKIFMVIFMVIVFAFCAYIIAAAIMDDTRHHKMIGEKVVVGKDTLIIMDYSYCFNNYTLSNGNVIAEEGVEKFRLKK